MEDPLLDKQVDKPPGLEVPESMVYFVYMTVFIDTLAACISTPVMPYYAQSFGVSIQWIGYLYGAWSFSSTVFAPQLSAMADRWGRKTVLVTCLFGAGLANIIQGSALYVPQVGFYVFLFGRAFSGCWASVGATCNVYISDVASKDIRGPYLEKLSMVPIVAILLGPGLGGATASAFGNNVPIIVDGVITLVSACVVMKNLVETPAFLQLKAQQADPATPVGGGDAKVPVAAHIVGCAAFFGSVASSSNLAMLALFFQHKYGLTTLYIGFVFILMSIGMLISNVILVPTLKKLGFQPGQLLFLGGCIAGSFMICFGFSDALQLSVGLFFCATLGNGINMSQSSTVVASFTTTSNRGKIFGMLQTYQNMGKIVGPILATHIATIGIGVPFLCSGSLSIGAACVYLLASRFMKDESEAKTPQGGTPSIGRTQTMFGAEWTNEEGTDADVLAIGKYVSGLLVERHYKWISRRAEIEKLLDIALPELSVEHRDAYEESFKMSLETRGYKQGVVQIS